MLQTQALYFLVAALLFFLVNWVGAHARNFGYIQLSLHLNTDEAPAFNFILKAFAPVVATVLFATLAYSLDVVAFVKDVWLIAAHYWLLCIGINVALGRGGLLSWPTLFVQAPVSIGAAYLAYLYFVVPRAPLFPKPNEAGTQLWTIIALFLYATFNNARYSAGASERRKVAYIKREYSKCVAKYGALVSELLKGPEELSAIAYAIMIHENFNRPPALRSLERAIGPVFVKTFGIMQVQSSEVIDDAESVRLGLQKIQAAYELASKNARIDGWWGWGPSVIADFNRDDQYVQEVTHIVETIRRRVLSPQSEAPAGSKSAA